MVYLCSCLLFDYYRDHANGNDKLVKLVPGQKIVVYGGDDRIPALNARVGHGDQFKVLTKCRHKIVLHILRIWFQAIWQAHKKSVIKPL